MAAHGTEPSRSPRGEPGRPPRGVACAGHVFAAHVRGDPELVWAALTDPGRTAAYLYGLAAHSTGFPPIPSSSVSAAALRRSAASCTHSAINGCPT